MVQRGGGETPCLGLTALVPARPLWFRCLPATHPALALVSAASKAPAAARCCPCVCCGCPCVGRARVEVAAGGSRPGPSWADSMYVALVKAAAPESSSPGCRIHGHSCRTHRHWTQLQDTRTTATYTTRIYPPHGDTHNRPSYRTQTIEPVADNEAAAAQADH